MTHASDPDLLVLHAVRLLGFAGTADVAGRFGLDPAATQEELLDAQARGWVTWTEFAGSAGWSLTAAGRVRDGASLAAELNRSGAGPAVRAVHREFLPLNTVLQQAVTDWQLRPAPRDALAPNDHQDPAWDARVLDRLTDLSGRLVPLCRSLTEVLARFDGYDRRFAAALARVDGDRSWVDRPGAGSCHGVWFELHEDLLSTLGVERGAEDGQVAP